ncbi:preprotein translocase subunit SecG, partial [Pseudomonas aeruginosa]
MLANVVIVLHLLMAFCLVGLILFQHG